MVFPLMEMLEDEDERVQRGVAAAAPGRSLPRASSGPGTYPWPRSPPLGQLGEELLEAIDECGGEQRHAHPV